MTFDHTPNLTCRLGWLRHIFSTFGVLRIFHNISRTLWLYVQYILSFLSDERKFWRKNSSKTLFTCLNYATDWPNGVWGDFGTPGRVLCTFMKQAGIQPRNQSALMNYFQKLKNLIFCKKKEEFGTFFQRIEALLFWFHTHYMYLICDDFVYKKKYDLHCLKVSV